MPRLSIIVPVYNVEKYLSRCLESLIHQSMQDIEIILINDGSTDDSERICCEYAAKDERIQVISKSNGGQSEARNIGLDAASGETIGFVDSDDYIDTNMYEYLYKIKEESHSQIAVGGVKMLTADGKVSRTRTVEKESVLNRHDAMREILYSKRVLNSLCNKLFDRSLFECLRFPVGQIYEDAYMIYDFFHRATTVAFTDKVFYYYCENQASTTHRMFSEREFDRVKASLKKIDFMEREYPDLIPLAEQYLVYDCMMTMSKMKNYDHKYDELLLKNLRKYRNTFLRSDHSIAAKLYVSMASVAPVLTVHCNQLLEKWKLLP